MGTLCFLNAAVFLIIVPRAYLIAGGLAPSALATSSNAIAISVSYKRREK